MAYNRKRGLTVKQEKFCNKYIECGNASEAYRYAYDCAKHNDSTVWANASRLLDNSNVAARIDYLKSHLAEAAGISALQIIREHQKIAFSNGARIRKDWMLLKDFEALSDDEKSCVRSVETKQIKRVTADGDEVISEWVKVTTYDKQKSLDALSRMLGYEAPTKVEVRQATPSDNAHKVIFENYQKKDD